MRRRRLPSPTLAASRALLWRTRFGNDTELIAVKLVVVILVGAAATVLEVLP